MIRLNLFSVFLLITICLPCLSTGQNYNQIPEYLNANNVWTFADSSGLDFSSGTPGTPIISSAYAGGDGSASACDPVTGDLLFYSDGERCYDASHQVMPNGDSILSGYGPNALCIVPFINDNSKYYLFAIGGYQDVSGAAQGLHYSVIDMTLNGGAGDVISTQKNVIIPPPLKPDSTSFDTLSTAMIAIPGNHCDVWLLTHAFGKSVFYAYHITSDGVDTVPVTSIAGNLNANGIPVSFAIFSYISGSYYRSLLAVSPDRAFISISSMDPIAAAVGLAPPDMNGHLLCRFDSETGLVSDPIEVENDLLSLGSAFSPDGSKLYLYHLGNMITNTGGELCQYDLTIYDSTSIATSKVVLDSTQTALYYNMQLFRDTIFMRSENMNGISLITSPNLSGAACDVQLTSDTLLNYRAGLHSEVVYSLPDSIQEMILDTLICNINEFTLSPSLVAEEYQYQWSTGSADTSLSITTSGTYWVTYTNGCHYRVDTFQIHIADLNPIINVNVFQLSTTIPYSSYQWMLNGNILAGETLSVYNVTQNGDYQVIVSDESGCLDTSAIYSVNNYTGIEELSPADKIIVYPNPATDLVTVKAPVGVNLTLSTPEGRWVKQVNNKTSLQIGDLADGIYFLRIEDKAGRILKVVKLIKSTQS